MSNKIEKNIVEETPEVVVDPSIHQEGDSPEATAYRNLLAEYKQKNPVKYEKKKEEFIKKLQGKITVEEVHGPNGKLIRRTFKVPNIQKKRVSKIVK